MFLMVSLPAIYPISTVLQVCGVRLRGAIVAQDLDHAVADRPFFYRALAEILLDIKFVKVLTQVFSSI